MEDISFVQVEKDIKRINDLLIKMDFNILSLQEYVELQYLLLQRRESFCYSYPLVKTTITGDKVMFIADTHFGNNKIENSRLIDIAYNKAIQENIKTVIHVGDLTEACCVHHDKEFPVVLQELMNAINHMPDEITTNLLLGNHDYSAIRTHPDLIPYYFSTQKLFVLGMQEVLLNWENANILVSHPISQLKMANLGSSQYDIILEGHHHYYNFYEYSNMICLPSLNNDTLGKYDSIIFNKYNKGYCYLFVIASNIDEYTKIFEVYSIDRHFLNDIRLSETIELNTKTKKLKLYQ